MKNIYVKHPLYFLSIILLVVILYLFALYNYVLYHTLIELFCVVIANSLFLFTYNTRNIIRNRYYYFIGASFLFVGVLDIAHLMTYKGFNIIPNITADVPTKLWLSSRLILSSSLFVAPFFLKGKINNKIILAVFGSLTLLLLTSILYWHNFPTSFIPGQGLTEFKKVTEYIICIILFLALFNHSKLKNELDPRIYRAIQISIIVNIFSDFFFTLYVQVYDVYNLMGHYLKSAAYYLIYISIIQIGLTQPYEVIFKELNELNDNKDDFIHVISHEIKNPLTVAKVFAQQLSKNQEKGSKDQVFAQKIDGEINKITRYINDLHDISQIETGNINFNKCSFDINTLITTIVGNMQKSIGTHHILLQGNSSKEVFGDQFRVEQVITNLLSNAFKYSPEGKEVVVTIKNSDKKVIVSVQDLGMGIDKEKIPYVFDKYFRTQTAQKTTSGLGIGLYLSREIIKAHQGEIWVESEFQKGSTFYFTIPSL